uniref:DUF5998 family protein n=1 Tax=Vaginimicrobium propionicum TaxID=1871034 RepID=UPI0009FB18C9|nr:DUF5998 family protein [Vaginimicrobium propionicum]
MHLLTELSFQERLERLKFDIDQRGFFPELTYAEVREVLSGEPIIDFLLHNEATFAHEQIGRHMTVLVLTQTRFLCCHIDEQNDNPTQLGAVITTDVLPLSELGAVTVTKVMGFESNTTTIKEAWLTLGWRNVRRIDLEPASCSDPNCDADHGYTGISDSEDMVIRMSDAADGANEVANLVRFASQLQRRTR